MFEITPNNFIIDIIAFGKMHLRKTRQKHFFTKSTFLKKDTKTKYLFCM